MNMKQMIKILSVLLLIAATLLGCSQKESGETADPSAPEATEDLYANVEETHESVEAKLENFLVPEEDTSLLLTEAKRQDGTLVDANDDLLVLRTADVSTMAIVTENFTVYNASLDKSVLTVTNLYTDGNYDSFSFDNLQYYESTLPESVMSVTIQTLSDSVRVIEVATAKITEIDEEVREENENACKYEISLSYEYYDIAGKFLAKTATDDYSRYDSNSYAFGTTYVTFDSESGEAIRTVNGETETLMAPFDFENERYGYYFYEDDYRYVYSYLEVYNKMTNECILRYYIDNALKYAVSNNHVLVLNDGDIFIQNVIVLPEESVIEPDCYVGAQKFKIDQMLLDVETGATKAIKPDFVLRTLCTNEELQNNDYFEGLAFTEHTVNLALVEKIENKQVSTSAILVLDNDMSVMYELPFVIPEHDLFYDSYMSVLGLKLLSSGDYLVTLGSTVAERAIVAKDGTLRAYLPDDAIVIDKYVVTDKGIFDYDMKSLYVFEDEGCEFLFTVGNKIVVSYEVTYESEETTNTYYAELSYTGSFFERYDIFSDESIVEYTDDYVITKDDKYTLYNAQFEHLLTTENEMTVVEADGNYYVYTSHEGSILVYAIN